MAEESSAQEKTESPSLLRLDRAREEGKAPRSRDLVTTVLLLTGALGLAVFGGQAVDSVLRIARANFGVERLALADDDVLTRQLTDAAADILIAVLPLLAALALVTVAASIAIGGFIWSGKPLMAQLSRLDPVAGLGRMFSMRVLVELGKALLKFVVVGAPTLWLLQTLSDDMLGLSRLAVDAAIDATVLLLLYALAGMALATVLVAIIDIAWQRFDFMKNLRMSKQEVKEELKDTDGRPEVRARMRALAQELARKRMLNDVPQADVIITNPEHYAVALRYDEKRDGAPRVLAKGTDATALRIRQLAATAKVPVVRAPPLARAVFHSTDIGREIPAGLYVAVARVLAYVQQLARHHQGLTPRPELPAQLDIPPHLAR